MVIKWNWNKKLDCAALNLLTNKVTHLDYLQFWKSSKKLTWEATLVSIIILTWKTKEVFKENLWHKLCFSLIFSKTGSKLHWNSSCFRNEFIHISLFQGKVVWKQNNWKCLFLYKLFMRSGGLFSDSHYLILDSKAKLQT